MKIKTGEEFNKWREKETIRKQSWRKKKGRAIDHIIPLLKDGKYTKDNIQLLCERCHKEKTRIDRNVYEEEIT